MQTYSKNLEALVEERSKQLLEEKRRTDALLLSKHLLPHSPLTLSDHAFTKYTSFIHAFFTATIPSKLLLSKKTNKQTNKQQQQQITATNDPTPNKNKL